MILYPPISDCLPLYCPRRHTKRKRFSKTAPSKKLPGRQYRGQEGFLQNGRQAILIEPESSFWRGPAAGWYVRFRHDLLRILQPRLHLEELYHLERFISSAVVLPENVAETAEVVRFISKEISKNTYVDIMDQYRPCYKANEYPPLDRRMTSKQFTEAVNLALKSGLTRLNGVIL